MAPNKWQDPCFSGHVLLQMRGTFPALQGGQGRRPLYFTLESWRGGFCAAPPEPAVGVVAHADLRSQKGVTGRFLNREKENAQNKWQVALASVVMS